MLYGSETGNAYDVANELGSITERLHFLTRVSDLDSIDIVSSYKMHEHEDSPERVIESVSPIFDHIDCYLYHRARGSTCECSGILEEPAPEAIIFGLLARGRIHNVWPWR